MQDITLSTVDLAIIASYFLLVFFIGFRIARRTRSADDLFLAFHQGEIDCHPGVVEPRSRGLHLDDAALFGDFERLGEDLPLEL